MTHWTVAGTKHAAFLQNQPPDLPIHFFLHSSQQPPHCCHRFSCPTDIMLTNFRFAPAVGGENRRICTYACPSKALKAYKNSTDLLNELKHVIASIKGPAAACTQWCIWFFKQTLHLQVVDGVLSYQLSGKVSKYSPCNIHFIDSL